MTKVKFGISQYTQCDYCGFYKEDDIPNNARWREERSKLNSNIVMDICPSCYEKHYIPKVYKFKDKKKK